MNDERDAGEGETREGADPSDVALRLQELKSSTMRAARERARLPQPLFWSLFHAEIKELKRKKALARTLDEILNK